MARNQPTPACVTDGLQGAAVAPVGESAPGRGAAVARTWPAAREER